MSDLSNIAAITMGAIPGALFRFYLTEWSKKKFGGSFPIGTFVINLTGCLAIGFFFTISQGIAGYPNELDLLIRTGFLGSYTTFSTYSFDTLSLWRSKKDGTALLYWAGSAILGVLAVILGVTIARPVVM